LSLFVKRDRGARDGEREKRKREGRERKRERREGRGDKEEKKRREREGEGEARDRRRNRRERERRERERERGESEHTYFQIYTRMYTRVCGSYPIHIYTKTRVVARLRCTLLTLNLVGGVNKSPARLHTKVDGVRATHVQVHYAHDTSLPFVAAILLLLHPCNVLTVLLLLHTSNVLRMFSVQAIILWKVGIMHDVHGVCE